MDNYEIMKEIPLEEYHSEGTLYRHKKTGTEIFHIANDDEENLFSYIFKTPPADSTGLAHIVEHSVLSGSRNYPTRDPFIQMLKGSMYTFLNAMTYSDKTMYPGSSLVEEDFFNLLQLYGDAVFFPLLKEEIFLQEGHRLQLSDGSVTHSGVVYNEMKGNYSSLESIASEWSVRALFDRSPYRFDSGGEPLSIGTLTYDQFTRFHREHYHPSNCRIFLYGNIPASKILPLLHERFLRHFSAAGPAADIPDQPRWTAPRRLTIKAPASAEKASADEATVLVSWLTSKSTTDPEETLKMEILSAILLGNPGAPLYHRLTESKLGQDIAPSSGIETQTKPVNFTVGLRGMDPGREEELHTLLDHIFTDLADNGIPGEVIEGAMDRVEFRIREKRGGIPFGLQLLTRSTRGWLHGASPEATMIFTPYMEKLRKEYADNPGLFSDIIRKEFLENNHRAFITILPDSDYSIEETPIDQNDRETRERAERETALFTAFQESTDSPEALATIPMLSRKDIPEKVEIIETETFSPDNSGLFYQHRLPTNGVVYVDIGFPVDHLGPRALMLLPFFGALHSRLGCEGMSHDRLSRELFQVTGGFSSFPEASTTSEGIKSYLFFRLKCLEDRLDESLGLVWSMLATADFTAVSRIGDVLAEMKNDTLSSLLPRGNNYAMLHAVRRYQTALQTEELWKGLNQLLFLYNLADDREKLKDDFPRILMEMRSALLAGVTPVVNITAEDSFMKEAETQVTDFISRLNAHSPSHSYHAGASPTPFIDASLPSPSFPPFPGGSRSSNREYLGFSGGVGFAGAVCRGAWLGTREHAAEALLAQYLRTGYLWEKVRMNGGAYGVHATSNGTEGVFGFSSYRDPSPDASAHIFTHALEYTLSAGIDASEMEKALIGTVGKEIAPLSPGIKGFVGLRRRLYSITDEQRQARRSYMLELKEKDLLNAAEKLLTEMNYGYKVVLAGSGYLEKLPGPPPVIRLPV